MKEGISIPRMKEFADEVTLLIWPISEEPQDRNEEQVLEGLCQDIEGIQKAFDDISTQQKTTHELHQFFLQSGAQQKLDEYVQHLKQVQLHLPKLFD